MRTKNYLMALALPAVFAACTSDDLMTENNLPSSGINGEMVELNEGFALNLGRNGAEAATKATWENVGGKLKFFWYPWENGTWRETAVDEVGLCWYGTDGDKTYATSAGEIYTNYQFKHFGWKILGSEFDYEDDTSYAIIKASADAVTDGGGSSAVEQADYALENYSTAADNQGKWDGSQGLFSTENKSIFKGDYIVYTPYQSSLKEIGHIPAIVPDVQYQSNTVADSLKNVGEYTVSYGKAEGIDGGVQAEGLKMRNLTNVIRVSIANKSNNAIELKKVILLDKEGKGFYKTNYLSATKIFAEQNDVYQDALNSGEEVVKTNAISVEFLSTFPSTAGDLSISATSGTATACIVAMPTTIADMAVVLVNKEGKAKIVDQKNFSIERGGSAKISVEINDASEFNTAIVTSEAEWTDALTANTPKVVALGQVAISSAQSLNALTNNTVVSAIGKESGLIFNNTFTLNTADRTMAFDCFSQFNGDVTVTAGTLQVANSSINADVALGDSLIIAGDVEYQNGTLTPADGSYLFVEGTLELLAKTTTTPAKEAGQIQNEGTIIVKADGELVNNGVVVNAKQFTNSGKVTNNAEFYNQSMLTNNSAEGFVNNGDFYDQIGSQFNAYNVVKGGNYLCDVQDDASNNRLAEAVRILGRQTEQVKKIIRFTDTEDKSYDLYVVTSDIDIIVEAANSKTITIDENSTNSPKFIKSLTVKNGIAKVAQNAKFNMNALEIMADGTAKFENNSITTVKTPVINEGDFEIIEATTGNLAGIVYCPAPVDASKGDWIGFVTYESNFDF